MLDHRRRALALVLPAAVLLAGCASSGSLDGVGSVGSEGTTPTGSSSGSSSSSTGGGLGATGETLAAQLHQGVQTVQSAHFELKVDAAGQGIIGTGDEKLASGKLTAMRLTENLPGGTGSIGLVLVGGKTYVKLPSALNKSGKPWLLATTSSTNPVARQLAQSLGTTLNSASVGSVGAFVDAAKSIKTIGRETVNGVAATRVHIVVDVDKLAKTLPNGQALSQAGLTELPLDMWLDDEHRPVQITESLQVSGEKVETAVELSRYNQPVTITAPPASQVGS